MTLDLPGFDPADPSTWHPMHGRVVCTIQGAAGRTFLGIRPGTDLAPAAEHISRALFPLTEPAACTCEPQSTSSGIGPDEACEQHGQARAALIEQRDEARADLIETAAERDRLVLGDPDLRIVIAFELGMTENHQELRDLRAENKRLRSLLAEALDHARQALIDGYDDGRTFRRIRREAGLQ